MTLARPCWTRALPLALLLAALAPSACAESTFDREVALLRELLALRDGSVIADVGAGDGEYAIALSRLVGASGKVYATELSAEDREDIAKAAAESGASRVSVAAGQPNATGLPRRSCDGVFMRGVYHHLTEPDSFVASLFETIRPGGKLVVVDFPPTLWLAPWTPDGIPESRGGHGIQRDLLIEEVEAAGFRRVKTLDEWPASNFVTRQYGIVFERPAR